MNDDTVVEQVDPGRRLVLLAHGGGVAADSVPAEAVAAAHRAVTGQAPEVYGVPYGSDQRLLTAADVPTVLYGPGDVSLAHSPDESVPVAELVTATLTLVTLIAGVCGTR